MWTPSGKGILLFPASVLGEPEISFVLAVLSFSKLIRQRRYIEWVESNKEIAKAMSKNQGYEFLQGFGKVQGRLIGGCIGVMEMMKALRCGLQMKFLKMLFCSLKHPRIRQSLIT